MAEAGLEILALFLLILANGAFALSEIAVVSSRKARLAQRAADGEPGAKAALDLANDPGPFLSTVQIGITLIGILTGALGGATLTDSLAARLDDLPAIAPYSRPLALGIVVLGITFVSLVLGELAPKRLGLNNPERIAALVARPMRLLARIARPAERILSLTTEGLLRILGVRPSTEPPVTEEEIHLLVRQGTHAGVFDQVEQAMLGRVLRLGDRRVSGLMLPRTEVVWLDLEDPPEENRQKIIAHRHSLFPVCRGNFDHVLGVVEARDLLARCLSGEPLDLEAAIETPHFVPEGTRALKLLQTFRETGRHVALVVDEYGGTLGLITSTDLLEAIVGDLPSAEELLEPEAVRREDGSWLIDGLMPVEEFRELVGLRELPDGGSENYETLGGLVMTRLARIPVAGDLFEWEEYRFEVVDMDGHRVDKVLVTPLGGDGAEHGSGPSEPAEERE
jgi:putative hemolysin